MFEHMAETVVLHRTLFSAVEAMTPQDSPTLFISPSTVLLHVCLDLPLLLLPVRGVYRKVSVSAIIGIASYFVYRYRKLSVSHTLYIIGMGYYWYSNVQLSR